MGTVKDKLNEDAKKDGLIILTVKDESGKQKAVTAQDVLSNWVWASSKRARIR